MSAGKLGFTAAEYKVREDGTWLTSKVRVERTEGFVGAVSVKVTNSSSATVAGRATRKVDFIPENPTSTTGSSQLLEWADGEGGGKFCEMAIAQDSLIEGIEFIPLSLGSYKGGAVPGAIIKANLVIVDDDSAIPSHQWVGTALQFQNPDGSWGSPADLKGESGINPLIEFFQNSQWFNVPLNAGWSGELKCAIAGSCIILKGKLTATTPFIANNHGQISNYQFPAILHNYMFAITNDGELVNSYIYAQSTPGLYINCDVRMGGIIEFDNITFSSFRIS